METHRGPEGRLPLGPGGGQMDVSALPGNAETSRGARAKPLASWRTLASRGAPVRAALGEGVARVAGAVPRCPRVPLEHLCCPAPLGPTPAL